MIGAQKARTLVKNQWRQKTTSRFFFVSVHDCRKKAMAKKRRAERVVGLKGVCCRTRAPNCRCGSLEFEDGMAEAVVRASTDETLRHAETGAECTRRKGI